MLLRKVLIAVTPRFWLLKTTLSNGAVVYGKNTPGHGGRGIFLEGDSSEPELEHLTQLLDNDAVFIDIGASTGVFALKAAKHVQHKGMVIAVEPGLEVLTTLSYSVKANGLDNVRLRNFCIGERTGADTLWLNRNSPNAFSLHKRVEGAQSLSVFTVTLDDLCAWERLTRLDYVKIDAVGAEQKVITGARQSIQRFGPILQVSATAGFVPIDLPGYSIYRKLGAANMPQANVVYVRDDDQRLERFLRLGWQKIGRGA
jgi:FkbM family methyltransferase